jgi:xanthine dehydrogenase accessory factor
MDSVDLQVLKAADAWLRDGHRAVLGTVVRTWGSSPRPVGSLVVVRDDGLVVGSVSGGCIEDDLVARFSGQLAAAGFPLRLKYGATADEAFRFGLPCGGTIELVIERLSTASRIGELLARVVAGSQTRRTLNLVSGEVALADGDRDDVLACDGDRLVTAHGPRWRMLLIGAGQLAHYVAQMALSCDYEVLVCEPRREYADAWATPGTALVATMPDDTVLDMQTDPRTAIVALTHDPKLDDLALIEALKSDAFYVGAIGSQRTQAQRRERLREFGVTDGQLERLHGPVGLKNGARTPPEIAASIITEITACKYGFRIPAPQRISSDVSSEQAA